MLMWVCIAYANLKCLPQIGLWMSSAWQECTQAVQVEGIWPPLPQKAGEASLGLGGAPSGASESRAALPAGAPLRVACGRGEFSGNAGAYR